jgi:hypothetical protein
MVCKRGWAFVGKAGWDGCVGVVATGGGADSFWHPAKEPARINIISANHLIPRECAKPAPISMKLLRGRKLDFDKFLTPLRRVLINAALQSAVRLQYEME